MKKIMFNDKYGLTESVLNGKKTQTRRVITEAYTGFGLPTNFAPLVEITGMGRTTIKVNIQYVHELQHALRLCGLNELADNFKV